MAELLSEQIRKKLRATPIEDSVLDNFYDDIEGMSDEEVKKYIAVNKPDFDKNPAIAEYIPEVQQYVSEEPNYGATNIDYDKIIGSPDALDKFYDYTMKDMEYFGSKVGMTGREFMKQMAEDKIKNDRKKIAHGEDKGGWFDSPTAFAHNLGGAFMNVLAPRSQEAIERGEEPSVKDVALDVAVDAAQTLPMGKLTKVPAATKALGIRNILANAAVPTAAEVADAAAYDEENPRGDFDIIDVAKGTGVNVMMPRIVRKFGSDKWDDIGKNLTTKNIPYVRKVLARGMEAGPSEIITNKTGDVVYQNRATPLPIVGSLLEKEQKERKAKEEREKNKAEAEHKYKGKLTRKQLLGEE